MRREIVRIQKIPNIDLVTELVEYMIYHKMSYPTGQKDVCTVYCDDANNQILTPDTIYKLSDELYLYLYLLSNKAIADIYKTIKDDQEN